MCSNAIKTVMIVDDDAGIRETLVDYLEDEGYAVVEAAHGQDAIVKLRGLPEVQVPCVILLDLMMPVMNGAQFFEEQQNDPLLSKIPVVVISADGNIREKAQAFGGEYLRKPMKIDQVLDAVERHCARLTT